MGVEPSEQTVELRILLTLAERIRSHAAHTHFLALPDYLGQPSALPLAETHPAVVQAAVALLKIGNDMVRVIGGRDMHPESATVGGFLRVPTRSELDGLRARLEELRPGAVTAVELFNSLSYPELRHSAEHFSLYSEKEYVSVRGSIRSADREFEPKDYDQFMSEYHEPQNTANFVVREGHTYMVGSLSRVANNFERLSPEAKQLAQAGPLLKGLDNPHYNNLAQAVELLAAVDQAIEVLGRLQPRPEPVEVTPREGRGVGAVEVPRGTLWHEYELDSTGHIRRANIITPTAQNLRGIEEDLRTLLPTVAHLEREKIKAAAEQLIRAYDPCFSCAAHFLRVRWL